MKNVFIFFALTFMLMGCNSDDTPNLNNDSNNFNIQEKTYAITNYVLEQSIDLNADGVFSTDILEEDVGCLVNELFFRLDSTFVAPNYRTIILTIDENQIQGFECFDPDGSRLSYQQNGTTVKVSFNDVFYFNGELSNNNETLTFIIPNEHLYGFNLFQEDSNSIIRPDGTIIEYTGSATLIYELIE